MQVPRPATYPPVLAHSFTVKPASQQGGKVSAKLIVELGGCCESMEEVDLEVAERDVRITVNASLLTVPLPFKADVDATKAKFVKGKNTLKITILEA